MDFTPLLDQLKVNADQSLDLLRGIKLVLCMGDRAVLTLMTGLAMNSADVVGSTTRKTRALDLIDKHQPDMVILGDRLEQGDGVDLAIWLKTHHPDLHVLLLVRQRHRRQALRKAIQVGCDGIVLQSSFGSGAVLAALRAVSGGGIFIDRSLRTVFRAGHEQEGPHQPISRRECEVLQAVAGGNTNQEIGQQLHLSPETVKTHLGNVLRKLPAQDRTQAAVLGLRWGLIDWPETLHSR